MQARSVGGSPTRADSLQVVAPIPGKSAASNIPWIYFTSSVPSFPAKKGDGFLIIDLAECSGLPEEIMNGIGMALGATWLMGSLCREVKERSRVIIDVCAGIVTSMVEYSYL